MSPRRRSHTFLPWRVYGLVCAVLVGGGGSGGLYLPQQPGGRADREVAAAADAVLTGRVFLPANTRQERLFRGRMYRSRTRGLQGVESSAKARGTAYEDVILYARPLSFEAVAKPLPEPARIDQVEATFIPHVTPVTVGSVVAFVNDDPFYHNVFSLTPGARFNIGRRPTGDVVTRRITYIEVTGLGVIQLFCDIHTQMNAYIVSLDTPYFTRAQADGSYRLEGLPAGRYEVGAYHPSFERVVAEVRLEEGEALQHDVAFSN